MWQHEIVIHLEHGQLVLQTVFTLTQGVDPTSHRRHALSNVEIEPFNKSGVDFPATGP
jgi:hypothetical protein